jgi:predicted ferric reductase
MGIEAHPFTVSSAPKEHDLRLTIKASGDWTTKLAQKLTVGTAAHIEGPFGTFSFGNMPSKKQIWIAGGIGITPFLSMARALQDPSYEIDLWYSVKQEKEMVSREEFVSLAQRIPSFRFHRLVSDTDGYLTADRILEGHAGIKDLCVMICGPEPMKNALSDQFRKRGVDAKKIFFERFNLSL